MRRERRPSSWLRGLLLFLLGGLLGANATYFVMSRGAGPGDATSPGERIETPLPVQILEVSPRGHFWQLVVQPTGWQSEPFSLVYDGERSAPVRGERLFVGLQQARLYQGATPLRAVAFAESA